MSSSQCARIARRADRPPGARHSRPERGTGALRSRSVLPNGWPAPAFLASTQRSRSSLDLRARGKRIWPPESSQRSSKGWSDVRLLSRGALIEFTETFPSPVPNVIIFQYNPETMTHGWTPATTNPGTPGRSSNPLAITGEPQETFSFTLAMDSNDMIADGDAVKRRDSPTMSGVYTRLAALEMLLFPIAPPVGGLIGSVTAALGIIGSGSGTPTAASAAGAAADGAVRLGAGPDRAGAGHRSVDHREALRRHAAQSHPRRGADQAARADAG